MSDGANHEDAAAATASGNPEIGGADATTTDRAAERRSRGGDEDGGANADAHSRAVEADLGTPAPPEPDPGTTIVARTVVRLAVPIIMVTSIALLLQGHNLPGGGFIGGVLTASAFALLYVVFGLDYLREELLSPTGLEMAAGYRLVFSLGLALAVGSGLVPIVFGLPFLTQAVTFVEGIPVYGTLEVASAFAFDLGVYFTVVGALLTVLTVVGAE